MMTSVAFLLLQFQTIDHTIGHVSDDVLDQSLKLCPGHAAHLKLDIFDASGGADAPLFDLLKRLRLDVVGEERAGFVEIVSVPPNRFPSTSTAIVTSCFA